MQQTLLNSAASLTGGHPCASPSRAGQRGLFHDRHRVHCHSSIGPGFACYAGSHACFETARQYLAGISTPAALITGNHGGHSDAAMAPLFWECVLCMLK